MFLKKKENKNDMDVVTSSENRAISPYVENKSPNSKEEPEENPMVDSKDNIIDRGNVITVNPDENIKFIPSGDKGKDLLILVIQAVDEWAKIYHLDNMPRYMLFDQALTLLNSWRGLFPND